MACNTQALPVRAVQDSIARLLVTRETQSTRRGNQANQSNALCTDHFMTCGAPHRDCRVDVFAVILVRMTRHALGSIRILSQRDRMNFSSRANFEQDETGNPNRGTARQLSLSKSHTDHSDNYIDRAESPGMLPTLLGRTSRKGWRSRRGTFFRILLFPRAGKPFRTSAMTVPSMPGNHCHNDTPGTDTP